MRDEFSHRLDRDRRRAFHGKPIDPRTDRRECDASYAIIAGQFQAISITIGEGLLLTGSAAMPDRSHGVDHVTGRQSVSASYSSLTGGAPTQYLAFRQQFWSGRAVNRAINATTSQKRGIRGVHDRIDRQACDIA